MYYQVFKYCRAHFFPSETRNNMAALTTAEHQTAMDKLEAEKAVLSAQVEEQNKKLWALQSACTDLTNNGYLNRDPFYLTSSVDWPEDWTSQQRKEGDERNDLQNEVRPMFSPHELRNRS